MWAIGDMWHHVIGRKSTIKDKWIWCNLKSHLEVDKWQEREDNSLDPLLTQSVWGKEEEKERGKEGESFRERESTFSLYFPTIGLSNPGEARGKVNPHCKGYPWVPILWSFDNSER